MTHDIMILRSDQLPKIVVLLGPNGEREAYEIAPARRKFGASLQKLSSQLRDAVLRPLDRK